MDWLRGPRIIAIAACGLVAGCYDKPGSSGGDGTGTETETSSSGPTTDPSTSTIDPTSTSTGTSSGSTTDPSTSTTDPSTSESSTGTVEQGLIVYINFEGPIMTAGATDDARQNVTAAGAQFGVAYQPYGGDSKKMLILERLGEQFAPFDIEITDMRPLDGNYTMVVVSPTNPAGGNVLGIGSGVDCDNQNPNNVAFAFFGSSDLNSIDVQANEISHQVGLSVGLDTIADNTQQDVMEPASQNEPRDFVDDCIDVQGGAACVPEHEMVCGNGTNKQNSLEELLARFGPAP